MKKAKYERALEIYMTREENLKELSPKRERILVSDHAMILYGKTGDKEFIWLKVVLTSQGIYYMKEVYDTSCTICPPEKFCPTGPSMMFRLLITAMLCLLSDPHFLKSSSISFKLIYTLICFTFFCLGTRSLMENFLILKSSGISLQILIMASRRTELPFINFMVLYSTLIK